MPAVRFPQWAVFALFACLLSLGARADDWTTFGRSPARNGYNPNETTLNAQTAQTLVPVWSTALNGPILTQPVLLSGVTNVPGTSGPTDLVYAADLTGLAVALNAQTGALAWSRQLPSMATACGDFQGAPIGVQGTPTIDRPNNRMWMVAADGTLWALALDTGATLSGYPKQIIFDAAHPNGTSNGQTINYTSPTYDSASGSLYVTTASQCDILPWLGQVIKVNVGTSAGTVPTVTGRWYPTGASGESGGGIWGPGGVSMEANGSYLYAATGNAIPDETIDYADHVVKLNSSLAPVASDGLVLNGVLDVDFGATPLLFQPSGCAPLAAVVNKSGVLLLYDRSSSGLVRKQTIRINPGSDKGNLIGVPVYDPVSNQIFIGNPMNGPSFAHGLLAFKVQNNCTLAFAWQRTVGLNFDGTNDNPVIPAVVANGVVYYATGNDSKVYAYYTAGDYLWSSGSQIGGGIYAAPTVSNGLLLIANYFGGSITAFGPGTGPAGTLTVSGPPIVLNGLEDGAFALPSSFNYTFTSTGDPVNFTITNLPPWLRASSTQGTTPSVVTFSVVGGNVHKMLWGIYWASIAVTNTTNSLGNQTLSATLLVRTAAPPYPHVGVPVSAGSLPGRVVGPLNELPGTQTTQPISGSAVQRR